MIVLFLFAYIDLERFSGEARMVGESTADLEESFGGIKDSSTDSLQYIFRFPILSIGHTSHNIKKRMIGFEKIYISSFKTSNKHFLCSFGGK